MKTKTYHFSESFVGHNVIFTKNKFNLSILHHICLQYMNVPHTSMSPAFKRSNIRLSFNRIYGLLVLFSKKKDNNCFTTVFILSFSAGGTERVHPCVKIIVSYLTHGKGNIMAS